MIPKSNAMLPTIPTLKHMVAMLYYKDGAGPGGFWNIFLTDGRVSECINQCITAGQAHILMHLSCHALSHKLH